ncbi:ribosomal-protein-alanine N-acetyltransferase [Desulfovibrio legallii]|uniref:[Ribosomal protein bS18]-alanine N-acetyltransferase n=2 Tax=Desulfovibrio legallii TaxID=571438 RepID=A0A1G7KK40_9BACT|nr:ribosomal-protein-alanine N-acetyltransferase [Desulfovibrio legallii]
MAALESQCFALPWSAAQCRAAFSQRAFAALGLWEGPRLCGYISVYHTADELEILNLAVSPERRRQGLGRRLLQAALRLAAKGGIVNILLEVRAGNAPAVSLYESCGFQRVGLRKGYYADTGEDAHVYALALPAAPSPFERSA